LAERENAMTRIEWALGRSGRCGGTAVLVGVDEGLPYLALYEGECRIGRTSEGIQNAINRLKGE